MAFVKCRPKIVKAKSIDDAMTILWANYNPQGQPFSKTVDVNEYDLRSNCTFFCDVEVANTTEETLISVGREINTHDGSTYPRSTFHFSYPVDNNLKLYMSARGKSGDAARRKTTPIGVSGNHIKIALNSNGLVVNGYAQNPYYYSEYFLKLYSDLTRPLEIGSTWGNHSNAHYNYVVVLKGFLSVQEMQELTSLDS